MRREAVATDPLAQLPNQQQAYHPPPSTPPPLDRGDRVAVTPPRPLPVPLLSPDESAEIMMNNFSSKCRKAPLDLSSVPADINGLQILARSHAWRHLIELSSKVISGSTGSTAIAATRLRIEGLFRLKMFDELTFEAGNTLSAEKTKLLRNLTPEEMIQNKNKVYAMQLLLAEIKAMTGNGEDALQELYQLRKELHDQIPSEHTSSSLSQPEWWSWRVTSSIVNTAIRQRLWRTALGELTAFIKSLRDRHNFNLQMSQTSSSSDFSVSEESLFSFRRLEISVLCRLSRILLQIGAMKSSQFYFKEANDALFIVAHAPNAYAVESSDYFNQVELTKGLMLFGKDKYEEAYDVFNQIIEKEKKRNNSDPFSIFDSGPPDNSFSFMDSLGNISITFNFDSVVTLDESVFSAAINNYAICALYLRKIRVAIDKLENLIKNDPLCNLIDPIVFNLCTLYDLSCSPDVSIMKKTMLQKLSTKYHVDDPLLHWRSFRLN